MTSLRPLLPALTALTARIVGAALGLALALQIAGQAVGASPVIAVASPATLAIEAGLAGTVVLSIQP